MDIVTIQFKLVQTNICPTLSEVVPGGGKVTRVQCLQAMKGDCSSSAGGRVRVIVMLVTVILSDVSCQQQTFLDQPWDVTVVAGDKVSHSGSESSIILDLDADHSTLRGAEQEGTAAVDQGRVRTGGGEGPARLPSVHHDGGGGEGKLEPGDLPGEVE